MIVPLALSALLSTCAPGVGPITMTALVIYESGGNAFAIGDNTARRSYFPDRRRDAEILARRLLEAGHDIDLGYAQINSGNFATYGLDPAAVLDPCTNVATGAHILQSAYARALRRDRSQAAALVHALSLYNSGGYSAGMRYVHGVYRTAALLRFERLARNGIVLHAVRAVSFVRGKTGRRAER